MKKKTLIDFLNMLKNQELIVEHNLNEETDTDLVEYISYNSMEVKPNTLFVCKGVHFKNE